MSVSTPPAKPARPTLYASYLAAAYLVLAGTYILVSGWLAAAIARDVTELAHIEHIKGIAFVLVTGALLWGISWMMFARLQRANLERSNDRQALMLVQSKAYAAELAASVAHDFNNLLLVVSAGLDDLASPDERLRNPTTIAEMRQALGAAKSLTERMARAARGRREVRRGDHALATLTADTVKLVERLPRMRNRDVECAVEAEARALLDPVIVEQILVNLLLNAADATGPGGRIRVLVTEDAACVRLSVEDNGPGLTESQKLEILEPFRSTKPSGLGLGLLSVRSSVEVTEGKLSIERSSLGGARFSVSWPKPNP